MPRLFGTFAVDTYVLDVQVGYKRRNKKWHLDNQNINTTYVGTQEVQFAPWFKPGKGHAGQNNATLTINGAKGPIDCWPFTFTL